MPADDTTLHTTGKSIAQIQETLQLCLDRISVWCNVNHMLINHVKKKKLMVIITTRQRHQPSDLSMSLSLDGQNVENVTEHRLLGLIVDNKFRWQAQIEHVCKSMSKKLFLLSQLQHIINIDTRIETLLQRSLKTSHSLLCVSSMGWLWRRTLKTIELSTSQGRQVNPS